MLVEDFRARLERIFSQPFPTTDNVDVETLIVRVQALLNARQSFEKALRHGPLEPHEDELHWRFRMHREAFDLFLKAGPLFSDLLGVAAFHAFFGTSSDAASRSEKRAALISRIRVFRKLLSQPDWAETLVKLTQEIADMDGGDLPQVLTPEKRNPGQPRQPYRVARLRLRALCWNEYLDAQGISAAERQAAIASAYRATWDAIRKWRVSCEESLGPQAVWEELSFARNSYWAEFELSDWKRELSSDGGYYYDIWRQQRGPTAV